MPCWRNEERVSISSAKFGYYDMKLINTLTKTQFEKYQTENMEPALAILNIELNKFEKRKQVAARLLGFNSFESIKFNKDDYYQTPNKSTILVAKHPKLTNLLVVLTLSFAICIDEKSGSSYFINENNLSFMDITEKTLNKANWFEFELNFEPKEFELGFEGVKSFDVGLFRLARLRVEFDWKMRNGLVVPIVFKVSTKLTEKPTLNTLKTSLRFNLSTTCCGLQENQYEINSEHTHTGYSKLRIITDEMVLWEVLKSNFNEEWKLTNNLTTESFDCVKIAYAFLSAQKSTQNKRRGLGAELKTCIEKWGGRYVSHGDIDMAIKIHPDFTGNNSFCNISKSLIMPCYHRLSSITEAKTQDYSFQADDNELDAFKTLELGTSAFPFKREEFINIQDVFLKTKTS